VRAGTNAIQAMFTKCKNSLGVICDCKMSIKIKGKFRVLRWMRYSINIIIRMEGIMVVKIGIPLKIVGV